MQNEQANPPGTNTSAHASALLMITQDRVRQLARDGVIPKAGRDAYPLVGLVQGYLRFLADEARRSSRSAAGAALHDVRRRDVEHNTAEADRNLVACARRDLSTPSSLLRREVRWPHSPPP